MPIVDGVCISVSRHSGTSTKSLEGDSVADTNEVALS